MTPAATAPSPTRSCVVCSLPRSGSWLLAEGLSRTGLVGRPQEYLRPDTESHYARDWGLGDADTLGPYVAAMLRDGTTPNGVFGIKVHWQDCRRLLRRARAEGRRGSDPGVLAALLPDPRYIHLVRRDTVAQAVSWARALDTDAWWRTGGERGDIGGERAWDPDFDKLEVLVDLLVEHHRAWLEFFAAAGVTPLTVVYEDLVEDYDATIRRILEHVGVEAAPDLAIPAPALSRQADALSRHWVAAFCHYERATAPERLLPAQPDARPPPVRFPAVAGAQAPLAITSPDGAAATGPGSVPLARRGVDRLIGAQRWLRRSHPFPHIVAHDVLLPDVYAAIDHAFAGIRSRGLDADDGFSRRTPGYDAFSHTFKPGDDGPFAALWSRPWHDMLCALTGVRGTGHIFCGLHHHAPGSASGSVHNDLNPGFFPRPAGPDEVVLADHARCAYATGEALESTVRPFETVRGVAVILFLHNPPWQPGDGGEVGLYRSGGNRIGEPAVAVPPINNSMLVFECTPYSFHGFVSNRRTVRNSYIMWVHRPRQDVAKRWGAQSVVPWTGS